jgi:S1-C subfamily serine protease
MKKYFKNSMLLLILVISTFCQAQNQSANTSNIDFRFNDGKIYITYDIINSETNELYNITTTIYREDGSKLNATSLSGDIFEVKGGNSKIIIWDQNKDGYVLDEKIYVTLGIVTKVNVPLAKHLLKSAIFPGWGDYKVRNGKLHFLYGVAGFGAIGASIYMNAQANQSYTNYKKSLDFSESNNLFNKAKQQQTLSYVFASTAALVWSIDLATLLHKTNKVKKNITPENSKYYFNKTQQTNTFTSNTNSINTKQPYDIALERGDKLLYDEKYDAAKIAYEEAKNYKETETIKNKIDAINKIIEEDKNRTASYNASLAKAQALLAQKQYKEAKTEFEIANKLKPKEKYPLTKISQIDELLAQIENQELYETQINKGITYLQSQDFETAKSYFETALKYKPADAIAINKIKECENGLAMKELSRIDSEYKQKITQANNLLAAKKYDEALDVFQQANELKPDAVEPINKIAVCENAINKIQEAADDAEYKRLINLADAAYNNKQYDKARELYIQAQSKLPYETYPAIRLASINKKMESGGDETDMNSIYEKCKLGVFYVMELGVNYWDEVKVQSQGSGFFIRADGIGVSNYHVLNSSNYKNSVVVIDKDNLFEIEKILDEDKALDYVIFKVKLKNKKIKFLEIASTEPKTTNKVFAIGNPEGLDRIYTPGTVIGFENNKNLIDVDVSITHGSSGGPLFNMKGEVVGITKGGHGYEGGNFNIAVNIQKLSLSRFINR